MHRPKKHVLDCPDYQSGECPRGRTCPLRHFKRSRKRTSGSVSQEEGAKRKISRKETRRTVTATKEPGAFRRLRHKLESKQLQLNTDNHTSSITPVQLDFIPLDTDKGLSTNSLSKFITLCLQRQNLLPFKQVAGNSNSTVLLLQLLYHKMYIK